MQKERRWREHDRGYKLLFSHAEMVADLLRGFVREEWVRDLDFSTLERVPGSYVTPELSSRESDVVWRLRWGRDRLLYVYLLIEFQSTVDPFMALRMMVYLGLLYQDLVQQRQLTAAGKLPPILPLVLYNGNGPWGAAQELSRADRGGPGRPGAVPSAPSLLPAGRSADGRLRAGVAAQPRGGAVPAGEEPGSGGHPADAGGTDRVVGRAGARGAEAVFHRLAAGSAASRPGARDRDPPGGRSSGGQVDAGRKRHGMDSSVEAGRPRSGTAGGAPGGAQGGRQEGQEGALAEGPRRPVGISRALWSSARGGPAAGDAIASIEELTEFVLPGRRGSLPDRPRGRPEVRRISPAFSIPTPAAPAAG